MSSASPPHSSLHGDDGRWLNHNDLGRIRSGPRGQRFWQQQQPSHSRKRDDLSDRAKRNFPYDIWRRERFQQNGESSPHTTGYQAQDTIMEDASLFVPAEDATDTTELDDGNKKARKDKIADTSRKANTVHQPPTTPGPAAARSLPPALPSSCKCPISLYCEAKDDSLIDCRTLVVEWTRWKKRQEEENQPE